MARPVDIKKKVEELRGYLIKYNGIPSQTENLAAHTNIKYYIKNHSDMPEIKALIEEFDLIGQREKTGQAHMKHRIKEIRALLEEYERIPKEMSDYNKIYYFFNRYHNIPEVEKLMYIYVASECYMKVVGRPLYANHHYVMSVNCNLEGSCKYIKYVFEKYRLLPARKSPPMFVLFNEIRKCERSSQANSCRIVFRFKGLFDFLREMIKMGCNEERFIKLVENEDKKVSVTR